MGNKQQLQLNNETLGSILSNVLGLPSQDSLKHGAYVWKKLTAQGGDFVDFVVSDDPTAYPDGGEQGGYWYEKFQLDPTLFGCTAYAIDKFTFTSLTNANELQINHSLGGQPKRIFLYGNSNATSGFIIKSLSCEVANNEYGYASANNLMNGKETGLSGGSMTIHSYSDYIKIYISSASFDFQSTIEYTLITMA